MNIASRFSRPISRLLILLCLIVTAGCSPATNETILADVKEITTTATVTTEPTPTVAMKATATATIDPAPTSIPTLTSTPTVVPTPTLPPHSVSTLPDEFKVIMDAEACPHPCYLGLMVGQTKDEVLAILQTIDAVGIEINDEEDFEGLTDISWQWRDHLLPFLLNNHGIVAFRDGYSVFFGAVPSELIPISLILEEFGEPDYIDAEADNTGLWWFKFIYLYQDTIVLFGASGFQSNRPTSLSANTLLQGVTIEEAESFFNWVCEGGWEIKFQEWKGYGGLDVYYDQHGNRLDEVSIVDCADYEQADEQ